MKIIHIDLDDTLCDYTSHYQNKLSENPAIPQPQSQYGFFENLDPLPGALDAFWKLYKQYDVYVSSRPSYKNPLSYLGKRVWVERHLGLEMTKKLIICYDKGLLIGDYLIDDHPDNDFQGEVIHFGTQRFPNWEEVLDYLL